MRKVRYIKLILVDEWGNTECVWMRKERRGKDKAV